LHLPFLIQEAATHLPTVNQSMPFAMFCDDSAQGHQEEKQHEAAQHAKYQ
tara:strand:+ start:140 stop:289 length:150 start_codon:yes stop_codon:yes gene_type:complete